MHPCVPYYGDAQQKFCKTERECTELNRRNLIKLGNNNHQTLLCVLWKVKK